jgi:hypothetical protein
MEKCVSVLEVLVFLFLIFCCCGLVARIKSDAKEIELLKSNEVSTMILVDLNERINLILEYKIDSLEKVIHSIR